MNGEKDDGAHCADNRRSLDIEGVGMKRRVTGIIYPGGAAPLAPRIGAFRQGLRDQGYVEGTNIAFDIPYADGRTERLLFSD